jgi:polyhydroxyalkanoate synthesis repressor PhaR
VNEPQEKMMDTFGAKPRLIKKYKNRRLYDLEISQYITVEDLQRYVLDGIAFQVIDAASSKDITCATLLQIFVEMEAHSVHFLSPEILRQLIVFAQHPMSKSLNIMLEQIMTAIEKPLQNNAYLNEFQQATDIWNKQTQQFLSQWQDLFKPR